MRRGTREIILGLRIGDDPEDIVRQVLAHMRRDETTETILDVMWALYAANGTWPSADKWFRLYLRSFPDLWIVELTALPVGERCVVSLETLRALGMAIPAKAARVAGSARSELLRQGFVVHEEARA